MAEIRPPAAVLLGLTLMEQSKFAEAEPLLTSGYRGLVQRKSAVPITVCLQAAGERMVHFYNAWGKPDEAAHWRKELQAAESQPSRAKER